jgi:hypothetical protein
MVAPRDTHTATLLTDGRVLVAGGYDDSGITQACEVYDPRTEEWSDQGIGLLSEARRGHTATLLRNGKVLVAGGDYYGQPHYRKSVEIFDPADGSWETMTPMNVERAYHTATLLPDGKVLVTGGATYGAPSTSSVEIYDPDTDTWTEDTAHPMAVQRKGHTATLLPNGTVLVAGGTLDGSTPNKSAQIYSEGSGWSSTGSLIQGRFYHSATLLPDGTVLVAGGTADNIDSLDSFEIFSGGSWTASTETLIHARCWHTASLLPNGQVLVTGGSETGGHYEDALSSCELFDPTTSTWTATQVINSLTIQHAAVLLPSGQVLIAGGYDGFGEVGDAELFDPGPGAPYSGGDPLWALSDPITPTTVCLGTDALLASGSNFQGLSECSGGGGNQNSSTNFPLLQITDTDSNVTYVPVDPTVGWTATSFKSVVVDGAIAAGDAEVRIVTNGIPSEPQTIMIQAPPEIDVNTPEDPPAICSGSTATLTVSAAGTGLHFQWYQGTAPDTTNAVGTDSSSYTTGILSSTTSYWVRVTGTCSPAADSRTATVTVSEPASIAVQPASTSVCSGDGGTTLSVTAAGDGLSFQWYQGTASDTSIPVGTNTDSYDTGTLTSTTSFWVRVSGICGSPVDSSTATVTANQPASIAGGSPADPAAICTGTTATLTASATGAGLSYQWYRGTATDTSHPVGTNSNSFTTPTMTTTTSYWVRVTGTCGSPADSRTATVTVIPAPTPTISGASGNICPSTTVDLSTQGGMTDYQWYVDAGPIEGATSSSYPATASGTYTVSYSNGCGTGTSAGHAVAITGCAPPPETAPGDTYANAQKWTGKTTINWPVNSGATSGYHVYRGVKADLPNLLGSGTDSCTRATTPDASSNSASGISEDPSGVTGRFYWYLVTGLNWAEGTAGNATAGMRTVNSTGTCP